VGDPPTKKDRDKSTQLELLRLNYFFSKKKEEEGLSAPTKQCDK
jgi:hypothetical protein